MPNRNSSHFDAKLDAALEAAEEKPTDPRFLMLRIAETLPKDAVVVEEALTSARAAGGNRIAFDRLHGLARLEERPQAGPGRRAETRHG